MTLTIPEIPAHAFKLGFSENRTGGHMSRSMMVDEITILCKNLHLDATPEAYKKAILDDNILGKPTFSSRQKSFRHLVELYSLDPSRTLFRIFRKLVENDPSGLPLLAMICTFCRDPQLRYGFLLIDSLRIGEVLSRERMEEHLESGFPDRFSVAMKRSLAQNINTTWTVSGHLSGRVIKRRTAPEPQFTATIYAMLAGYLAGLRGEMLIESIFGHLVAQESTVPKSHLAAGAGRGWLRYRSAGGVTEIDFSPMLTQQEREILHGTD
jgi:hypothetical protein